MNTNSKIEWSEQQQAVFKHFAESKRNASVEARAGTGKTTTIKEAFKHAPERRMLYAVFNKKNQVEAAEKIRDRRVDVLTLHSLGFRFIRKVWMDAKPDDMVEQDRVKAAYAAANEVITDALLASCVKLVGFLKNTSLNPSYAEAYEVAQNLELVGTFPEQDARLVNAALRVLDLSKVKDVQGRISFNDMVWLPVANNWVQAMYDLVVVDEAQDMNLPQLTMARTASKGRVIVVGDDRQAIYGFRGAVQNGMAMMCEKLDAVRLPLTITYRCPKAVVALAQTEVPDYRAHDTAPEGEVVDVKESKMFSEVKPGDAILSRLNAPLMPLVLGLLRKNIPARIEGRDIGKQLSGIVRGLKAKSVPDFIAKLETWKERQIARASKFKNPEKKIEQTQDIVDTLAVLAQDSTSVTDIERRLEVLFQDTNDYSKPAVVLSSVHKAKGLEWKRVWMLSETFRRGKGGEEANIFYVAVTRAQASLYLVGKGKEEPKQPEAAQVPGTSTMERAAIVCFTVVCSAVVG